MTLFVIEIYNYSTPVKEGFNTHQEAQEKLIEKLIEIVKNGTVKNR